MLDFPIVFNVMIEKFLGFNDCLYKIIILLMNNIKVLVMLTSEYFEENGAHHFVYFRKKRKATFNRFVVAVLYIYRFNNFLMLFSYATKRNRTFFAKLSIHDV